MITIAPYRSAVAGQARIDLRNSILRDALTSTPPAPAAVVAQDRQELARARSDLKEAQRVDQLSAATLAFLEIPLTEGAVLGASLLALDLARRRRDRADEASLEATAAVNAA